MERLPIHLSQASGVPYYRQIVDQVTRLVRSGHLAPGDQLPPVRELAHQLLVSLITVRRAYSDLEASHLIELRQGAGTYVAHGVRAASREQALSETREALREHVAHARRMGLDAASLRALLEELLERRDSLVSNATPRPERRRR